MGSLHTHYFRFLFSKITDSHAKNRGRKLSVAKKIKHYTLKNIIKRQYDAYTFSSGLYQSPTKKTVFIKSTSFKQKNSSYHNLVREQEIVKALGPLFSQVKKSTFRMPKILASYETAESFALVQEYIQGKELSAFSPKKQVEILKKGLETLTQIGNAENLLHLKEILPVRSRAYIFFSFFLFLGLLIVRDSKRMVSYLKLAACFSQYYLTENIFATSLVLSHRDLHTNNILVKGEKYFLIDPEVAAITENHTDLSILIRSIAHFSSTELKKLLVPLLRTNADRKKFLALSLYYAVQISAMSPMDTYANSEGINYLHTYFSKIKAIIPVKRYSFATQIIQLTLSILSVILRATKKLNVTKNVILCYHNVGVDSWNFTIHPETLTEQLSWLKQTASIVPVSKISRSSKKTEVAISFDDGYKSMITSANGIIQKLGITPMLFILGNPSKANRHELANKNPLLNDREIRKLSKAGWEIGYHTNTHPDLRKLSASELQIEVLDSKRATEKKLGIAINHFAYPRGIYDERVNRLMKKAHYKAAFTVDGGSVQKSPNKQHMQRVCFEGELELHQFQALVSAQGLAFYEYFMTLLKLKEKYTSKLNNSLRYLKKKVLPNVKSYRLDLKLDLW